MSIFSAIKDAIFGHKTEAAPAAQAQAPVGTSDSVAAPAGPAVAADTGPVDVVEVLEDMAASKGNPDLNYKTSIVDLMKLLDLDSSLDHRKQLADELGYTGAKDGSAEMNIWLHKEVMRQLAANGGKVPAGMTD